MIFNMSQGGVVPSGYIDETIITPGTSDQVINAETYLRGDLTIAGDADLIPENIKKDIDIFGITGTHEGRESLIRGLNFTGFDADANVTDLIINYPGETLTKSYSGSSNNPIPEIKTIENVEVITNIYSIGSGDLTTFRNLKKLKLRMTKITRDSSSNFSIATSTWVPNTLKTITLGTSYSYPCGIGCSGGTMYCEASSKPSGWGSRWNYWGVSNYSTVVWGVSESSFDAL